MTIKNIKLNFITAKQNNIKIYIVNNKIDENTTYNINNKYHIAYKEINRIFKLNDTSSIEFRFGDSECRFIKNNNLNIR